MTLIDEKLSIQEVESPLFNPDVVNDSYPSEYDLAVRMNTLLDRNIVPVGLSVATRLKIIEKVLDCDEELSQKVGDTRSFEEKLDDNDYYGRKATLCLRAIARRARASRGIM